MGERTCERCDNPVTGHELICQRCFDDAAYEDTECANCGGEGYVYPRFSRKGKVQDMNYRYIFAHAAATHPAWFATEVDI